MAPALEFDEVRALGARHGLSLLGVSHALPLHDHVNPLARWQENQYAGEMQYMMRSPELLTDPSKLLSGVRTILVCAVRYEQQRHPPRTSGYGRVARYAWGKDYHLVLRDRLRAMAAVLHGQGIGARAFTDAVPLLERPLAQRAGLGFIGRHSLLIVPKIGSLVLLGELLLDCEITGAPMPDTMPGCGGCTRCRPACPTGAIVSDAVVDAPRCISYLTIEKRGMLAAAERRMLGEWIFGCDECQEVCPFNHTTIKIGRRPDLDEFRMEEGAGPLLDLASLLAIRDDDEFRNRFRGTPLLRTKREGLIRNGLCVAVNTDAEQLVHEIAGCLADRSGVVRATALWALAVFGARGKVALGTIFAARDRMRQDPDPAARHEAETLESAAGE